MTDVGLQRSRIALVVLLLVVVDALGQAGAEDGYDLCLRYRPIEEQAAQRYRTAVDRVLLRADVSAPSRVGYCWADSAVCTVYDGARLPAVPFEIEVQ
jgi:sialate O-acetylesterase